MAKRYFVHTLGCKLNQFDAARVEGLLRAGGLERTDDPAAADVVVLNTCTVTARADAEGRRLARLYRRLAPNARIVAAGCYAQRDPEGLAALGVFDAVVPLAERERLPRELLGEEACAAQPPGLFFADAARAYLRVQEGCNLRCSYCVIPSVRGPSRSFEPAPLLEEARRLVAAGVREIGLTGVNTGEWGRDLEPKRELADLLEAFLAAEWPRRADDDGPAVRFRLNSLEPRTLTPRLLALIAAAPDRLAPHVQVPLQSGSDRTLAAMRRNYRTAFYRDVVEGAAARVPGICLGADVIAGFPGETDDDQETTRAFVESLPLAYLHVFSYSPRPGTPAATMPGRPPADVARRRTNELRAAGARLGRAFRERLLGTTQQALVLDTPASDGRLRALTGNYVELRLPAGAAPAGAVVAARLAAVERDGKLVRAERVAAPPR